MKLAHVSTPTGMLRATVKRAVLTTGKRLGLYAGAARMTRHGLRILCYHGTSLEEEHQFLPQLFMSPQTFDQRLRIIAESRVPVLQLSDALERVENGTLPPGATVITIDDGFYGTYHVAWPMLKRYGFPATVYVTSYYCEKATPVFGLVVEYMLWRTEAEWLELDRLGAPFRGRVALGTGDARRRLSREIIEYGEARPSEAERVDLSQRLGRSLGVDYQALAGSRILNLMTLAELGALAAEGADIQAHTHRHRFPVNEAEAWREIEDNRRVLEPVVGHRLEHLCYPNGEWYEDHWRWLATRGIRSATTCENGLNYRETPRLALRRFLDGEHISRLEFEAELCGYTDLLRQIRQRVHRGKRVRWWRRGAPVS